MQVRLVFLLVVFFVTACSKQEEVYEPAFSAPDSARVAEYVVGIHPLHNPVRLLELYGPIIDHLNASIPSVRFRLEASRNYEEFDKKLYAGYFDFAMPNPYQTVRSLKHGYRVFGKMGDDELFRGIILVRKDGGIRTVADLKGKKIAYPAETALAATMMPQYYLHTHGLDINRDVENLYVGSQESSIMNVLRGHVAAGATWPLPWNTFQQEHPEMAAMLEVKWKTETLPNNGWVARDNIPPALVEQVAASLVGLNTTSAGKLMLEHVGVSHFERANDRVYQPVLQYLKTFSESVRHIDY